MHIIKSILRKLYFSTWLIVNSQRQLVLDSSSYVLKVIKRIPYIYSIKRKKLYRLEGISVEILDLLQNPMTFESLLQTLEEKYQVTKSDKSAEVLSFIIRCIKLSIVTYAK